MDYQEDEMKQKAVIFDIDGTLANCDHRIHHLLKQPKDWDSFFSEMKKDSLNKGVASIYNDFIRNGNYEILVVTGRPVKYIHDTILWFRGNNLIYPVYGTNKEKPRFFFRAKDDFTDDDIMKKKIYNEQIKDKYEVLFVIEDRQRVVDMWRSLGLTCLQCKKGNF